MSAINVNSITGRTGTHGPVLTGVTTVTGDLHVGGGVSFSGIGTYTNGLNVTSGSVGIGTDNPGNDLEIASSGNSKGLVVSKNGVDSTFLGHNGTGNEGLLILREGGTNRIQLYAESGQNSFINSGGNLGIGTNNPAGSLEIDAASTTNMIMLDAAGTNFARLGHNSASGTDILDVRSEGHTRFLTNGNNERLRITSAGRLGIGTATPDTNITLVGNTDGVVNLDTSDTRGAFVRFQENGTSKAWVGCSEGIGSGGDQDDLGLRAVDNIRFRAGANFVTINNSGNIVMGNGAGIDFSASATDGPNVDSELLDDYEEGTFEPTFTSNNGDFTSVTYHGDTGARYVKVGSLVTVNGCARCSSIDTSNRSSGDTLCIGGLPFTNVARNNGDNADNIGSLRVPVWGNVNNCPHAIQARQNQTFCTLLNYEIDAITNTNIVSQASNSMMVQFSLQYSAA